MCLLSQGSAIAPPAALVGVGERGPVFHDEEHGGIVILTGGVVGGHALVVEFDDVGVVQGVHECLFAQDGLVACGHNVVALDDKILLSAVSFGVRYTQTEAKRALVPNNCEWGGREMPVAEASGKKRGKDEENNDKRGGSARGLRTAPSRSHVVA